MRSLSFLSLFTSHFQPGQYARTCFNLAPFRQVFDNCGLLPKRSFALAGPLPRNCGRTTHSSRRDRYSFWHTPTSRNMEGCILT